MSDNEKSMIIRSKINDILDNLNKHELDLVYDYCNNLEYP